MKLYTIGFTQKTARQFFDLLRANGIQRVVDIRVHPEGQLAGFSKKEDLRYFLDELLGCDYVHLEQLAPTEEIMKNYRASKNWQQYRAAYLDLLAQRGIPGALDRAIFSQSTCCLLCSEAPHTNCHRSLAADLLARSWTGVEVIHL